MRQKSGTRKNHGEKGVKDIGRNPCRGALPPTVKIADFHRSPRGILEQKKTGRGHMTLITSLSMVSV